MKKFWMLAVVALAMVATGCKDYETIPNDPLKTRIYTLDNGLKVFMSVNKEQPRVQTYVAVKVGGKNDPAETTGLAHYFEHLMFKGTPNFGTCNYEAEKPLLDEIERLFEVYRKTTDPEERATLYHAIDSVSYEASKYSIPNEYDKLMSIIGATGTNAYTSTDETVYVEDIPSNQIDNWAKIQADRFRHPVIRGFHTELETIYEEKNMSLTKDGRKVHTALMEVLFPHHPYGTQTVLGTQEDLKNPSITNVKAYHKTYYVPNNMAISMAGDFDPDEAIEIIKKYFGDMTPSKNIPQLKFEQEAPITTPIEKEVLGPEAASVTVAWRLPKAIDPSNDITQVVDAILYNGQAGLFDTNLNKEQKVLFSYAGALMMPDYGVFMTAAMPKDGQTLEEARDLILDVVKKFREGDWDESLIQAAINNFKSERQELFDDYSSVAQMYVNNFINGGKLADEIHSLDRISKITKEDILKWANEYLKDDAFSVIYKRQGVDPNEQKIAAPKITPIIMNRDKQSDFLTEIQNAEVKPIEPVFVDFEKDMSRFELRDGVQVLYKRNTTTDLFTLNMVYNMGAHEELPLGLATEYIEYLDGSKYTAEEREMKMYSLACASWVNVYAHQTSCMVTGLSENMADALNIAEDYFFGAKADDEILETLKEDALKSRLDGKQNQKRCFSALRRYLTFGPEYIRKTTLTNKELMALTAEELLSKMAALKGYGHEILYYGPMSEEELKEVLLKNHQMNEELTPLKEQISIPQPVDKSCVLMAQYNAKQLYYAQRSMRDEKYDVKNDADVEMYDSYFNGGMNSIVFQEMRESRGLAYTASASLSEPYSPLLNYSYNSFIATQNDKMRKAIEAFDEIIENMPESEAAFEIAKQGVLSRLRTERTTKIAVLSSYIKHRDLGLTVDRKKAIYEKIQNMTLADVKAFQEKWVKGRTYQYAILGDIKDLDTDFLRTLGPVQVLTLEQIFGY